MYKKTKLASLIATTVVAALLLTGCAQADPNAFTVKSDGSAEVYGKTVKLDKALADMVPQYMKTKGTIIVSTDAAGPPRSFVDENGKIVGATIDIINSVGVLLGLKVDIQKNSFDAEVPGVQSGRFDLTSGTGDFPARRALLDMVDYLRAGYLYLVKAGNPKNVTNDPLSQCGLIVGVLKGTTQETLVTDLSKKCVDAGKKAIDLQTFNNVLLPVPLEAGRVDVVWENTSTGAKVAADEPKKFAIAGDPVFSAYLAFGADKKDPQKAAFAVVVQKAIQKLLVDGVYGEILAHWKQSPLAMDYISMNSDNRSGSK